MDFTEAEVIEELRLLGYDAVPPEKLKEFMADLKELTGEEKRCNESSFVSSGGGDTSDGLLRYPSHTSFHWGSSKARAFEKTVVSKCDSFNESVYSSASIDDSQMTSRGLPESPPDRRDQTTRRSSDDSISSGSVIRRKILRRDSRGNRDISTEELTYIEDPDDEDDENRTELDVNEIPSDKVFLPMRIGSAMSDLPIRDPEGHLPSFIRKIPEPPRKRHDPVNRYHQYREAWSAFPAAGEKQHKDLRWAIREQMQRHDRIHPIQRCYEPNTFVPPTEKRRQKLRWQIRTQLAHRKNPSAQRTHFNVWM